MGEDSEWKMNSVKKFQEKKKLIYLRKIKKLS